MKCLTSLGKSITKFSIYGFDIETTGDKNDFLMGSIVGKDLEIVFYDAEQMCKFIIEELGKKRKVMLSATNLGFDLIGVFSKTPYFKQISPMLNGSKIIGAKFSDNKKNIQFMDTMSFLPISVERLGELMRLKKMDKPKYIIENRLPKESEMPYITEYNIMDSRITYEFTNWLQDNYNNEGANLNITTAKTSLELFRRVYMPKLTKNGKTIWWHGSEQARTLIFSAYYGGRTECFKRGEFKDLNYYDFNSMYAWAMTSEYPDTNTERYNETGQEFRIFQNEGVSFVELECPYMKIPFLPMRIDKKLVFPIGNISGAYTHMELRKAFELGYKLKRIGEQVYYTKNHLPFKEYIDDQYSKRLYYKKRSDSRELINKLNCNSLYGKFGQRPKPHREYVHKDSEVFGDWVANNYVFMTTNDTELAWMDKEPTIPTFSFPIYSVYTTAKARIRLYEYMRKCDCIYCDTDSLVTKNKLPTSKKLGDLKLEQHFKRAIFVRPKFYAWVNDENKSKSRIKGLPPAGKWDIKRFSEFVKNPTTEYTKFVQFKEAIARKLEFNEKIIVPKTIDIEDTKRKWEKEKFDFSVQDSEPILI